MGTMVLTVSKKKYHLDWSILQNCKTWLNNWYGSLNQTQQFFILILGIVVYLVVIGSVFVAVSKIVGG